MNCIFCKECSDNSKSIEHIIPESLGNKDHVLPPGIVCDDCNNYFAIKIEKELLDQPYFRSMRHRTQIESKKGIIPFEKGIVVNPILTPIEIHRINGKAIINYLDNNVADKIALAEKGAFIIPHFTEPVPHNKILSRFLAKVAIEALVHRVKEKAEWINEIMTKTELDEIKNYARYGKGVSFWPYNQRRIYNEEDIFQNPNILETYEILHEFHFFWTKENEFYFVLAIAGIEYAINLRGPSIETYKTWLKENDNKSVLEPEKEKVKRRKD